MREVRVSGSKIEFSKVAISLSSLDWDSAEVEPRHIIWGPDRPRSAGVTRFVSYKTQLTTGKSNQHPWPTSILIRTAILPRHMPPAERTGASIVGDPVVCGL